MAEILPNLNLALQIMLLGMGLVFGAILLLWGSMALLVRLSADRQAPQEVDQQPAAASPAPLEASRRESLKPLAAAAAVALALAYQRQGRPNLITLPPTSIVSAWQAVMRSNMLNKRGPTR